MLVLQKGFNYSQDGPGNRLVYHLQGCNFACKWCSNADSIPRENPKAKERSGDDIFDEIMRSRMMFLTAEELPSRAANARFGMPSCCRFLSAFTSRG